MTQGIAVVCGASYRGQNLRVLRQELKMLDTGLHEQVKELWHILPRPRELQGDIRSARKEGDVLSGSIPRGCYKQDPLRRT